MSPIDFASLPSEHPELRDGFDRLAAWLDTHPSATFLDPRRLARELKGVSPVVIAFTLHVLAEYGKLRRAYRVIAPTNHVLADGTFAAPEEIPARLTDTSDTEFDTAEGDLVQVFTAAPRE
jgi:hypothetical protein